MKKQDGKYILSLAVYIINLLAILLSCLFPAGMPFFAILFPVSLIPFALCIFELRHSIGITWGKASRSSRQNPNQKSCPLSLVLRSIPKGIKIMVLLSLLYVFISFFVNGVILAGGAPKVINEIPFQNNHGKLSVITWPEYHKLKSAESRLLTGHMLAFTAIPFACFSGIRKINSESLRSGIITQT